MNTLKAAFNPEQVKKVASALKESNCKEIYLALLTTSPNSLKLFREMVNSILKTEYGMEGRSHEPKE